MTSTLTATPVPLDKAWRLLNHGPVTLITTAHEEQRNVMAAAWVMPLDFDPAKVILVIDPTTYTYELMQASGSFVVNVPRQQLAQATYDVGHSSGRETDKFAQFGLTTFDSTEVAAPRIVDCIAWLECRVQTTLFETLVIGEVVAAAATSTLFQNGHWQTDQGIDTLHYIAGGLFVRSGEPLQVASHETSPFI